MVKSIVIMFLCFSFISAQGMQRPSIDEQMKELTKILELNDSQQDTIKILMQNFRSKMSKMRENMMSGGGDRMSMMSTFMDAMEAYNKKVKAVLNDDQKKKYDKLIEERMQRRRGRMRN